MDTEWEGKWEVINGSRRFIMDLYKNKKYGGLWYICSNSRRGNIVCADNVASGLKIDTPVEDLELIKEN